MPINNVKKAINHFIVVVIYNKKFETPTVLPDFYIIPSDKIPQLKQKFKAQTRLMKGNILSYKDKWELLKI